jgi:UDP-glucose 4-epimerase
VAKLLVDIAGSGQFELVPFPSDREAIDIGDFYADFQRARSELGWEPRVSLRDGLTRTLDYYRREGPNYW